MDPATTTTPLLSLLILTPLHFLFLPLTTLLSFLYTAVRATLAFPRAMLQAVEPVWVFCGIALIIGTCVGACVAVVGWGLGMVLGLEEKKRDTSPGHMGYRGEGEFNGWNGSEWEGSVDGMVEMREWEIMEAEEERRAGRRRRRGR